MNLGLPGTGAGDRVSRLVRQGVWRFPAEWAKSHLCDVTLIFVLILSLYQNRLFYRQIGEICLKMDIYRKYVVLKK